MPEENVPQEEEVTTTPTPGTGTEDADLESLFNEEVAPEGETAEEKVARLEAKLEETRKGVSKYFSEKGRKEKEAKQTVTTQKTPTHTSDDVTELFLESKPEAVLVKDDLQQIADAKYNGSIVKAWKNESWLQAKAKSLSEEEAAKGKIQPPSNQPAQTTSFEAVARMSDEDQAQAIKKMSDKDYTKWQEYLRKHTPSNGVLSL